jgi:HAAS
MENAEMELIDLYVAEVGQHLPAKDRADIEAEIRSLIEDTLEDKSQAEGRPADEEMIVQVLKEFGSPAKMAASYLPPRYLIGPRFYPIFMLVMRIVLALITVVTLVRLGVALAVPGMTIEVGIRILGEHMASLITTALAALGNMVFVFAIL